MHVDKCTDATTERDVPTMLPAPRADAGPDTSPKTDDGGPEAPSRRSRIGTRKGRRISSAACDLCRARKLQCAFEGDAPACRRCTRASVLCTFDKQRRPRGPPNKHIALAKSRDHGATAICSRLPIPATKPPGPGPGAVSAHAVPAVPMTIPIINVKIGLEQFCPPQAFDAVMKDFFAEIYPIMPLVHRPTFERALRTRRYDSDPEFFQLCVAMAVYTLTTFPQRIARYGWGGPDLKVEHVVEFASVIVRLGRGLESRRVMVENPTVAAVVCRMGLSYSCHHLGEFNNGWSHASEAVLMFRELGLYRAHSYSALTRAGAEISRRMFWILYAYTSAPEPLTALHFDTSKTDWDFLRTNECEYVSLAPDEEDDDALGDASPPRIRHTLIMAALNAFIGMHVSVSDLLVERLPSPPPFSPPSHGHDTSTPLPSFSALSTLLAPPPLAEKYYGVSDAYTNGTSSSYASRFPLVGYPVVGNPDGVPAIPGRGLSAAATPSAAVAATLQMIEAGMVRIRRCLERLPPELQLTLSARDGMPVAASPSDAPLFGMGATSDPCNNLRANIYMTDVFLRSLVVETYVAKMLHTRSAPRTWNSGTAENSPGTCSEDDVHEAFDANLRWADRYEIWRIRERIARDLQTLLQTFTNANLECTGLAMTLKIRRIAATLLDSLDDPTAPPDEVREAEQRRKDYVDYFVRILAELDHSPIASFGFVRMRS